MKLKLPKSIWSILSDYGNYDDVVSAIVDTLIDNGLFDHLPTTELAAMVSNDNPFVAHDIHIMSDNYECMMLDRSPHDNSCSLARAVMFVVNNGLLDDVRIYMQNGTYHMTEAFVRRQLTDMITMCTKLYNYCAEHDSCKEMLEVIHSIAALSNKLIEDNND